MCGSKLLFFCTRRGVCAGLAGASGVATTSPVAVTGVSHTTVSGIVPCRLLLASPITSTRPRTVAVVTCVVVCARNPAAPIHNIAIEVQIKILLCLIVTRPLQARSLQLVYIRSLTSHRSLSRFLPRILSRGVHRPQKRTPIIRLRCPALLPPSVIEYVVRCRYSAENNRSDRGR